MSSINTVMRGRVWKFGDSVDTNQLAGGGVTVSSDANENLKANCLRNLRPEFPAQVKRGDIVVAGSNFGCGSSRQSAVQALQACGVQAVIAESVARIHRRNSIALALPTFTAPGIGEFAADGDEIEIDYAARRIRNVTRGGEMALAAFPRTVERIYESGGIFQVIAQRLREQGIVPAGSA